jgi:ferredoxin
MLISEGYRATLEALDQFPDGLESLPPAGIHPLRHVELTVDPIRCVGCGLCVALNPRTFTMNDKGRAEVRRPQQTWTPVGDAAVRACPTGAIIAVELNGETR